ncbi:MAG: CDP-alcohol phosphatidyltransferase family protein [Acidimicrobiia bacterium]
MSGTQRRIVTVPNVISVIRLACVPLFLWLLWGAGEELAAGLLAAGLGATDWVDGYIARHFDQGSELGKILDPTADRVLLVAAAVAVLTQGLPVAVNTVVWIMLIREVLIAAATIGLALAGARRIDVVWAGKAGTLALMFSLPMFLGSDATRASWHAFFVVCAWGFAIGGIGLGYYAAAKYLPVARAALREGRTVRTDVEV